MVPECEVCNDLGVVTKNVPVEHPDFGKTFSCPACSKFEEHRQQTIERMSRLQSQLDKTFQTYQTHMPELSDEQNSHLRSSYSRAQDYAERLGGWLVLVGPSGTGKTHLAAAIAHACVARGIPTIFVTAPDLLDHLRAAYAPYSEVTYDQQFENLKNIQVLVLDDLGSESPTSWAQEKLYQLINHRYEAKLPTIFTSNVELDHMSERLASRLKDHQLSHIINLNLPDFRSPMRHSLDPALRDIANFNLYSQMSFETFDDRLVTSMGKPLNTNRLIQYAHQPEGWLMLIGGTGVGKTHLAAAIANEWWGQNMHHHSPLIMSTKDLMDYLRATFTPDARHSLDSRFQAIRTAPILFLDDFALHDKMSLWAREKLFQLIDYRYMSRLPTVIALTPNSFKNIEEHHRDFHSRLVDSQLTTLVVLEGDDYRTHRRSNAPK